MARDEEWRPVPGFNHYELTVEGQVRHKYTLRDIESGDGTVALQRSGKRNHRSVKKLVREAFGTRAYPVLEVEGFRVIPDFPGYSINRNGDIFNERSRKFLDHGTTVQLVRDGVRYHKTVSGLIRHTFFA